MPLSPLNAVQSIAPISDALLIKCHTEKQRGSKRFLQVNTFTLTSAIPDSNEVDVRGGYDVLGILTNGNVVDNQQLKYTIHVLRLMCIQ